MKQTLLAYVVVTSLFACGQDKGAKPLFKLNEQTVRAPTSVSMQAAAGTDAKRGQGDDKTTGVTGGCRETGMERLLMEAKGDTLIVSGAIDLSSCLVKELAAPDSEVLAADDHQQVYLTIRCEGVDLSPWQGKTYGQLVQAAAHPCAQATKAHLFSQTEDQQLAKVRRPAEGGPVVAEVGRRVLRLDSNKDGGPCTYEVRDGRLSSNDCVASHRSLITRSRVESHGRVQIQAEEGREETQRSTTEDRGAF